mmetsp:Transcript_17952/g.33377  ORF Transcript_17952/g.33377 Transcript_17952/m.33377 type:complete len:348 (+) Transcript_17952:39-1082(+)
MGAKRYKGNGWLDRLQKDAQKDELDHTNTSPSFFILLTLCQPPFCAGIAKLCGIPIAFAVLPILSHMVMFFVSHYWLKSCKYFDITGETTFFPLILYSHMSGCGGTKSLLVTALSLTWCTRLGLFLGWRIMVRGSDWRFDKLMKEPAYNCFGWVSQGTWIFLQGFAVWHTHHIAPASDAPLDWCSYLGIAVWAAGLTTEHVADMQKTAWNANTKSGRQTSWMREGLWKYSRHPNFFGENVNWLGIFIASGCHPVAFVSPLWSWFFLVFTSLMLLEKRLDKKFGNLKEYEDYKEATSVLVPWLVSASAPQGRRGSVSSSTKNNIKGKSPTRRRTSSRSRSRSSSRKKN